MNKLSLSISLIILLVAHSASALNLDVVETITLNPNEFITYTVSNNVPTDVVCASELSTDPTNEIGELKVLAPLSDPLTFNTHKGFTLNNVVNFSIKNESVTPVVLSCAVKNGLTESHNAGMGEFGAMVPGQTVFFDAAANTQTSCIFYNENPGTQYTVYYDKGNNDQDTTAVEDTTVINFDGVTHSTFINLDGDNHYYFCFQHN